MYAIFRVNVQWQMEGCPRDCEKSRTQLFNKERRQYAWMCALLASSEAFVLMRAFQTDASMRFKVMINCNTNPPERGVWVCPQRGSEFGVRHQTDLQVDQMKF